MPAVGVILLAAGGSRRMGQPKQLLPFAGTTLLRHACSTILATPFRPVIVVLGAEAERCAAEIADLPLHLAVNQRWEAGMAGSIRTGLDTLESCGTAVEGVLILLADQPQVPSSALVQLVALGMPAASSYEGILGVPAVFPRALFDELRALEGDAGARKILSRHSAAALALPEAAIDLDTPLAYSQALKSLKDVSPQIGSDQ